MTAHVTHKVLEIAGVEPKRLGLNWASAAEAPLFVRLITSFTDTIKQLGPLGDTEAMAKDELKLKLSAARSAVESVKLRTRWGKLAMNLRKENDYAPEVIKAKMAEKINEAMMREMAKQERAITQS
ncbi:MAG: hydrogenase iron-sulfur subunit [Proteobacteria bacterium]|nr:hydrogenase iron-sulfur subunit [Pseudomonadota bacterium]